MRVLVVEGSRALADVLVEGLHDEGMAVDVAYDGLQAATRRAQPAVLSAEDRFAQAWDENADPFTKTVHVTLVT